MLAPPIAEVGQAPNSLPVEQDNVRVFIAILIAIAATLLQTYKRLKCKIR